MREVVMDENCDTRLQVWLASIQFAAQYEKLFITGCPKSGTTWLMYALGGHPQIVANGEGRFAWRLAPLMSMAINEFNKDQAAHAGSQLGQISNGEFELVTRAFFENLFLRYLAAGGKPREQVKILADKTPQHVLAIPLLRKLFPTSRFINIVRDPRDAAVSALFHFFKKDEKPDDRVITFITQTWRLHVEAALAAERQLGKSVFLNIRYEDMHGDESNVLGRCLDFLKLDASDEMIQLCSESGSFEKLSGGRQRGQVDTKSFYRSGTIGDWKNHLDPILAQRACLPVQPLMQQFGYSLNDTCEVDHPQAKAA